MEREEREREERERERVRGIIGRRTRWAGGGGGGRTDGRQQPVQGCPPPSSNLLSLSLSLFTLTASPYGPSRPRLKTALVRDRPMRNSADR